MVGRLLLVCVAMCSLGAAKNIPAIAGPYRVVFGLPMDCPPELMPKIPTPFYVRVDRDRRNPDVLRLSGNITLPFTFDDRLHVRTNMASWSSRGGWKDNAYILPLPRVCSSIKAAYPDLYYRMLGAIKRTECPVPPGHYRFDNFTTDLHFKAVPTFFYGKWRITSQLFDSKNVVLLCYRHTMDIVPRV